MDSISIVAGAAVLQGLRPTAISNDDKYKCVVCRLFMLAPCQTDCGHRGCRACFTELKNRQAACPVGEEDCEVLTDHNFRADRSFTKELQKIEVYCPNKDYGCAEQMKYENVDTHLTTCVARQRPCPYGCGNKFEAGDLAKHENSCTKRPVNCPQCKQSVPHSDLEEHKTKQCPESVQICPFNCKISKVLLKELENHKAKCDKRIVSCFFEKFGCREEGAMDKVMDHQKECDIHWPMIIAHLSALETKVEEIAATLSAASTDMMTRFLQGDNGAGSIGPGSSSSSSSSSTSGYSASSHASSVLSASSHLSDDLVDIKSMLEEVRTKLNKLERSIAKQNELILTIEEGVENAVGLSTRNNSGSNSSSNEATRAVSEMQASLKMLASRVAQVEKLPALEESGRVRQVENEITLHSVRIAEMDLRVQCLEAASFDGRLLWKITDYKRRKAEALQGKTMSLYSQPFYTSRFGYKMCARLYLNGDGMGKGTHMSLFFVVMRGEYDQLLTWPFKQKVTFFLVDQLTNTKHVMDSFRPDPASTSFKRPSSDMNIASGCPLFAPQHTVEAAPYYSPDHDCIFIRVVVDTAGLENL